MKQVQELTQIMLDLGNAEQALLAARFFKTGPGEYGEGDRFLRIKVPVTRSIAKKVKSANLELCLELLQSPWHEIRHLAVLLMIKVFEQKPIDEALRKQVFDAYWDHSHRINNWDLVDVSTPFILGNYLVDRDPAILYHKVKSPVLWERRMAVIACLSLIKAGKFQTIQDLCVELLHDPHDLMHKACGWMLREMGKRGGLLELKSFLNRHGPWMPRTMLRYAIEKFPENERREYLKLGRD